MRTRDRLPGNSNIDHQIRCIIPSLCADVVSDVAFIVLFLLWHNVSQNSLMCVSVQRD